MPPAASQLHCRLAHGERGTCPLCGFRRPTQGRSKFLELPNELLLKVIAFAGQKDEQQYRAAVRQEEGKKHSRFRTVGTLSLSVTVKQICSPTFDSLVLRHANLVKRLTINLCTTSPDEFRKALSSAFGCSNLVHLEVVAAKGSDPSHTLEPLLSLPDWFAEDDADTHADSSTSFALRYIVGRLKSLSLTNFQSSGVAVSLLREATQLSALELHGLEQLVRERAYDPRIPHALLDAVLQLRRLEALHVSDGESSEFLGGLLERHSAATPIPSLRTLHYSGPASPYVGAFLRLQAPTLEHLFLHNTHLVPYTHALFHAPFPRLRSLQLINYVTALKEGHPDLFPAVEHLRLLLDLHPINPIPILSDVAAFIETLPSLGSLTFDVRDHSLMSKGGPVMLSAESTSFLRTLTTKRGIALSSQQTAFDPFRDVPVLSLPQQPLPASLNAAEQTGGLYLGDNFGSGAMARLVATRDAASEVLEFVQRVVMQVGRNGKEGDRRLMKLLEAQHRVMRAYERDT
ncbi:hypothetical protein JCM6882_003223 [Rhodosporidiobolus microsporus]